MNCIIIDDEPLSREGIKALLADHPKLELCGSFSNADAARTILENGNIDLLFLDIEMPGINGLEFARSIPEKTMVIFITAYPQYALDSYEVEAVDYIVKPVSDERFAKAVAKAEQQIILINAAKPVFESINDYQVIVKSEGRFHIIAFSNILYIEGLKDYIIIHTESEKIITAMNLRTFHSNVPENRFLRVNKSYIVNREKISSFERTAVYIGSLEIPLGRTFQADFYKLYLG